MYNQVINQVHRDCSRNVVQFSPTWTHVLVSGPGGASRNISRQKRAGSTERFTWNRLKVKREKMKSSGKFLQSSYGRISISLIHGSSISVGCWCSWNQGAFTFKSFLQMLLNSISSCLILSENRMVSSIWPIFLRYKNRILFFLLWDYYFQNGLA